MLGKGRELPGADLGVHELTDVQVQGERDVARHLGQAAPPVQPEALEVHRQQLRRPAWQQVCQPACPSPCFRPCHSGVTTRWGSQSMQRTRRLHEAAACVVCQSYTVALTQSCTGLQPAALPVLLQLWCANGTKEDSKYTSGVHEHKTHLTPQAYNSACLGPMLADCCCAGICLQLKTVKRPQLVCRELTSTHTSGARTVPASPPVDEVALAGSLLHARALLPLDSAAQGGLGVQQAAGGAPE